MPSQILKNSGSLKDLFDLDFGKLESDFHKFLAVLDKVNRAQSDLHQKIADILESWKSGNMTLLQKAEKGMDQIAKSNNQALILLKELKQIDIEAGGFATTLIMLYIKSNLEKNRGIPQTKYRARLEKIRKYMRLIVEDIDSLSHIIESQNTYLKKASMPTIVSDMFEHSRYYYLLNDQGQIIKRMNEVFVQISLELKSLPKIGEIAHGPYSLREILPPFVELNSVLQRVYDQVYVPLFPDEDERSDLDKLKRSLSERYRKDRPYHLFVLLSGPDPVGAIFIDYMACDKERTAEGKKIAFLCVWYIFCLEEHRKVGTPLLINYVKEGFLAHASARGDALIGAIGEVNNPFKMKDSDLLNDNMDPFKRQDFFKKNQFKVCDFNFAQPAEEEGYDPVDYVSLLFLPIDRRYEREIPLSVMQAVLGKFFTVEYYMDRIAVNKQLYDRMVDEIRKKGKVSLYTFTYKPSDAKVINYYSIMRAKKGFKGPLAG